MQIIKFKYLAALLILIAALQLYSQDRISRDRLYKMYQSGDFELLQKNLASFEKTGGNALDIKFFKAIFMQDGDAAKDQFLYVFDRSSGQLGTMAAERLMDYYFARGYYVNANRYQKYIVDHGQNITAREITDSAPVSEKYYIQVGAFGIEDNARQLKNMLATQDIDAEIVNREVGQKKLYCVLIPGTGDFDNTLKHANKIKSKYDLKFRIIKGRE